MDPDLHQNRIDSSLSHTQPVHHVSSKSVLTIRDILLKDKQTNKQTNRDENINLHPPSVAEVIKNWKYKEATMDSQRDEGHRLSSYFKKNHFNHRSC